MPADYLFRSFIKVTAISALDMNCAHEEEKDNLSNLIKESLEKKLVYKFPMPEWFKKAEHLTTMATVENNIIWIKEMKKLLLYLPFTLRQKLLFAAHGGLLTGHNSVKNAQKNYWNAISC
jgi:hypothetical protein